MRTFLTKLKIFVLSNNKQTETLQTDETALSKQYPKFDINAYVRILLIPLHKIQKSFKGLYLLLVLKIDQLNVCP